MKQSPTDKMVTNKYIEDVMRTRNTRYYKGVFSCDNIPIFNDRSFTLVANLSKRGEEGTHFVVLYKKDNSLVYFDPFGVPCRNRNILNYMRNFLQSTRIPFYLYVDTPIQHIDSMFCGFFCIAFCLCIENDYTIKNFLSMFSNKDLLLNDKLCIKVIQRLIKQA